MKGHNVPVRLKANLLLAGSLIFLQFGLMLVATQGLGAFEEPALWLSTTILMFVFAGPDLYACAKDYLDSSPC